MTEGFGKIGVEKARLSHDLSVFMAGKSREELKDTFTEFVKEWVKDQDLVEHGKELWIHAKMIYNLKFSNA